MTTDSAVGQLTLAVPITLPLWSCAALRVDELKISHCAPRPAADWWFRYRAHGPDSRFTVARVQLALVPGDLVDVACDSPSDAEWLRDLLISKGIPQTALMVRAETKESR